MVYAPGTLEGDPKKQNMALQQHAGQIETANTNIAANTTNIAANTANIASLTTTVAGLSSRVTSVATSGLATGGPITSTGTVTVTAASKSDQTTGTSNSVAVTPLHQKDHDSAAKAWAVFAGSSGSIVASSGVTSISRSSAGTYVVTFSTAFSSATEYAGIGSTEHNAANSIVKFGSGVNKTATTIAVFTLNFSGTLVDPDNVNVVFYGRQ